MSMKKCLAICVGFLLAASVFGTAIGTGISVEDESLSGGSDAEEGPIEIEDWHGLDTVREDLDGDYLLMDDLDEDTDGYEEYNNQKEDYEVEEFAGWDETWNEGDMIDIPFDEDKYDSILSVENETGVAISYSVDHPTITIDEDTGERYVYVTYENAIVGWEPIGDADSPLTGTFDGNGHEISDLYIDRPNTDYVGLFGYVNGEALNVSIADAGVSGEEYVGGLVGFNRGDIVDNSYAAGDLSGNQRVGGLVGFNRVGRVTDSYATGNLSGEENIGGLVGINWGGTVSNSYAIGDMSGNSRVGGLVGWNFGADSTVSNSYATGDVSGDRVVGGLVGDNRDTVENSYATGKVSGDSNVGGLVGRNFGADSAVSSSYATGDVSGDENTGGLVGRNGGTVESSYWDVDTSGQEESDGGTGLNTEEMTGVDVEENMDGFDFQEVWKTVEAEKEDVKEDGYPILDELDIEEQLKAQNVYVEDEDEDGIPGFTSLILLLGATIAVTIYQKKE